MAKKIFLKNSTRIDVVRWPSGLWKPSNIDACTYPMSVSECIAKRYYSTDRGTMDVRMALSDREEFAEEMGVDADDLDADGGVWIDKDFRFYTLIED